MSCCVPITCDAWRQSCRSDIHSAPPQWFSACDVPAELAALDARLDCLRERLRQGDPDLTDDELQGAIGRVQAKRDELAAAQSKGDMAGVGRVIVGEVPDAARRAAAGRRYIWSG